MRKYFSAIFPSLAALLATLVLPIGLAVYYVVTGYSSSYVAEQNINYFDVQGNFLGTAFLEQGWISWFNRFMDFAIWGILAAVVLVGIWLVSSAKVATKNHYAQEDFKNFQSSQTSWHSHFFVVALLKFILVAVIIYSVLAIVGKSVPQLQTTITIVLNQFSWEGVKAAVLAGLSIVLLQCMIIASIKTFKHLSLD